MPKTLKNGTRQHASTFQGEDQFPPLGLRRRLGSFSNHPRWWFHKTTAVLAWCVLWIGLPTIGVGDIIWMRGNDVPVFGRIESQADQELEIRIFENGSYGEKTTIPRELVEQMVVNIDANRLARLDPAKPESYRDYAEELAAQKKDLAAKHLAQRLYLLAAANAENNRTGDNRRKIAIQRSALLGLASLAESASERRRIDVLRHLLTPASLDSGPLIARDPTTIPESSSRTALMLDLVRAIRREQTQHALQLLSSPENRTIFADWREVCSLEELDQIARANRPSQVQLSQLLAIELQIVRTDSSSNIPVRQVRNWGDHAMQVSNSLGVLPTFDDVTPFDPRKSVYRNGDWMEPLSQ